MRDVGGDEFRILLRQVGDGRPGEVWAAADGEATGAYTPQRAGRGSVEVTLGGEHIGGSPFSTRVRSAPATGATSTAGGVGLHAARAGERAGFELRTYDAYGNATGEAASPEVRVRRGGAVVEGEVSGGDEGVYSASFVVTEAGDHVIDVLVAGAPVSGSPFRLLVSPAEPHAPHCRVVRPAPPTLVAGLSAVLTFESRDAYNNLDPSAAIRSRRSPPSSPRPRRRLTTRQGRSLPLRARPPTTTAVAAPRAAGGRRAMARGRRRSSMS